MKAGRYLRGQGGAVSPRALFWIIVIFVALYGVYKLAPPEISYYMIKTEVEDEARNAHRYTDESLARKILEKALTWKVPLQREGIVIQRGFDDVSIEVSYKVEITFIGGYKKVNHYYFRVVMPLKEYGGMLK